MQTIRKEQCHEEMVGTQEAVLWAAPGERVQFETYDCWGNGYREDLPKQKNPASGPLGIEGARAGDLLRITIHRIEIEEDGYAATDDTFGYLAPLLDEGKVSRFEIKGGRIQIAEGLSVPVDPMIGIIGVAPVEAVDNYTPHEHGGNMDCKLITEGSLVTLRAQVDGGLLSVGDLHAAMGDGEVCVSGLEIPGRITLSVEVLQDSALPTPFVETKDRFATIASRKTTDAALEAASLAMFTYLTEHRGLEKNTAATLMSLGGDLRICQVVDPQITARFEIPKDLFEKGETHRG